MKGLHSILSNNRLHVLRQAEDGLQAVYVHPSIRYGEMIIVASWGGDWDHVSVSHRRRCPTWDEMCAIKDIFWHGEECVVQYHPPESEYVNNCATCLHMWKPQLQSVPVPPSIFVGIKEAGVL